MTRYRKRTDGNHAEIRDGLRDAGYAVKDLSMVGYGVPDLLVIGRCGRAVFIEIKMPGEKLTPAELEFRAYLPHIFRIARSLQEAIEIMQDEFDMEDE